MNDIKNESQSVSRSIDGVRASHQSWAIPAAIIVGFGLIAASIYFGSSKAPEGVNNNQPSAEEDLTALENLAPITEDDHIRGNPNAPLVIVEYSDFDCPYCKSFHNTMQRVIDEYGPNGKVAWVYRHFPLTNLHPSAAHIAEASECVAELGGNNAFWSFTDLVFAERGTNEPTNIARLPEFAEIAGVDRTEFQTCLDSGRHKAAVQSDAANAVATGGRGTPHSIIVAGGQYFPINGAQPYDVVKQMVDSLLQ